MQRVQTFWFAKLYVTRKIHKVQIFWFTKIVSDEKLINMPTEKTV